MTLPTQEEFVVCKKNSSKNYFIRSVDRRSCLVARAVDYEKLNDCLTMRDEERTT